MSGRSSSSITTLPVGSSGGSLPSTTVQARPRRLAAAAVMRTWLLWRPPPVTSTSQPCATASAHRYSSLRTLFPPPARPVRSSRFTTSAPSAMPSSAPSRSRDSTGVGSCVSGTRRSSALPSVTRPNATVRRVTAPTPALVELVAAVEAALDDPALLDDRARAEAIRPAMAALLAAPGGVPDDACAPLGGQAVGNLLHEDPAGRFHVLAVVFPDGTSSG